MKRTVVWLAAVLGISVGETALAGELFDRYGVEIGNRHPRHQSSQDDNAVVLPATESPNEGAVDDQSGQYYAPAGQGWVNPQNGRYYVRSGRNGVIDTRTGQWIPVSRSR